MREKILEAARRLAEEQPMDKISMNDVAEEAEISRQTVYRYFGSKSNLIQILKGTSALGEENLDTRDMILKAASRVFSLFGFEETSMDEIAKEAGFTKGAVYWYFPSKMELFIALLENRFSQKLSYIPEALKKAIHCGNPVEGLTQFLREKFDSSQSDMDWPRLFLEFTLHSRTLEVDKSLKKVINNFHQQVTDVIRQLQCEGIISSNMVPEIMADYCYSLLNGILMTSLLSSERTNLENWASEMARMFWKGIAPK